MSEKRVYLDSGAIIKRYVEERGSDIVKAEYLEAYDSSASLAFSLWNMGEVLGVLDRAKRLGRLGEKEHALAKDRFIGETGRLHSLGKLRILPVDSTILTKSWALIEKYHIYQADAIQLTSAKAVGATTFMTSDKLLHGHCRKEGFASMLI